ncbi:hypothetical protein CW357_13565 [Rummeliibacillus sp. TYF005]|uniref:hypothetical protein n=1 Tax=Rummeliibacillus sp. TYF005 TaxID=2058214 RepID=UPI000F53950E|nr:hypothetical protein [Rummeliibacillus sp. TYF005]RPJ94806.1 hypothetical protein CW357_13565 [Rummeliibacillus sp. TYF005]
MIIKVKFDDDFIQYISCSTKVGRKINCIQEDFLDWIFDEEKNIKYWAIENGERICPSYDANALVEWLNNVRFKRGIAKANLITNPQLKVKKIVYY